MALAATITVDPRRGLTSISPLIYGQFLEHFHRQVFGGAFEPGSSLADGRGFRLWPNASDSDAIVELACGLRVVP
jgi:alpha-L-arabinofuranosidase